jgi:formate hydrogenlyase transcriptional activator
MFFVSRFARNVGKKIEAISASATERLKSYTWPGNVRELQNVIERALILSHGSVLDLDNDLLTVASTPSFPETSTQHVQLDTTSVPLKTLEEVERTYIADVLNQRGGVIEGANGAAKTLGLHPNTLRHRMEKLGIKRSPHRIS